MLSKVKIEEVKELILSEILEATKSNDTLKIVNLSKILEELEYVSSKFEILDKNLSSIINNLKRKDPKMDTLEAKPKFNSPLSAKAIGKIRLQNFLTDVEKHNIHLKQLKGRIYENLSKDQIGIASASLLNDKWFLGLKGSGYKDNGYDVIVLLCEKEDGSVINFILGKDFVKKVFNELSIDKVGQVKFNVSYKYGHYFLNGTHKLDSTIDNFNNLR